MNTGTGSAPKRTGRTSPFSIPRRTLVVAAAVVVLLHVWRRNTLLSIVAGTVVYMLLVQLVFVYWDKA